MEDELHRLAAAILEAAQTARAAGRLAMPVFAGYGVELTVTDPFALQTGLEGVIEDTGEDFQVVLRETLKCNPGELDFGLVDIPGGYAIGCLEERQPANPALLFPSARN